MSGLRVAVIGGALALGVLAAPGLWESAAYRADVQRLTVLGRARADRVLALAKTRERGPQAAEVARRLAERNVGRSLPALLRQAGEVATRARVTPSAVLVLPPVRVDVEREDGPTAWLEEYPIQITVPGSLEELLGYLEALAQAPLPMRVDWVRFNDPAMDPTRGVVLQLGVRVLVPVAKA